MKLKSRRDRAGPDLFPVAVVVHVFVLGNEAGRRTVPQGRGVFQRLHGGHVVGHDQDVFLLVVFKEVEDPLLFQQAGDEGKVAFPVLHAVRSLRVLSLQGEPVLLAVEPGPPQDLPDDVLHGLLLKDAHVPAHPQQGQNGHKLDPVQNVPLVNTGLPERGHHTVHEALPVLPVQGEQGGLAQGPARLHTRRLAGELHVKPEGA